MSQDNSKNSSNNESPCDSDLKVEDPLRAMFAQFMQSCTEERNRNSTEFAEIRSAIATLSRGSPLISLDSPVPDRTKINRRSSMFFGSPPRDYDIHTKTQIQVLQADIIYDKELKVSSLEGLQYLAKQLQLLTSKYPGREVKMSHMVSYTLRSHVIAAWNSYCFKESLITGIEPKELFVEDWLSLPNDEVQAILVESARPRTRESYSRELVLFLGKGIPQTPAVCVDNFSMTFYAPLMKSLNDLVHLYDLLSHETTNHSNNKAKMPAPAYGSRENPGQLQLWIISLGSQKEGVLQLLGKDELTKHKTLEPAVKYIRTKLMEVRLQCENRQDLDSKLTPVRYEDIRHTQGESHTRQQTNFSAKPQNKFPAPARLPFSRDNRPPSSFAALHFDHVYNTPSQDNNNYDDYQDDNNNDEDHHDYIDDLEYTSIYKTPPEHYQDDMLSAIQDKKQLPPPRNAVASTFRGYCSELFVFGSCPRQDKGCNLDHSTSGNERCLQSFHLLSKRELTQHSQLPPFGGTFTPEKTQTNRSDVRQDSRIPKPYPSHVVSRSYPNK